MRREKGGRREGKSREIKRDRLCSYKIPFKSPGCEPSLTFTQTDALGDVLCDCFCVAPEIMP